ncbi:tyrosine-type recombinase/integrase [Halobacterium bonnevillei]|uniref:Tyrosine-type recombinase/integrase n=1 Tax=Halobacterium bonnevillei TaxID=2692200 RepID=A0A6B0SJP0_9EURY|nr:tyrosine-type recombinase/integrase [Halobacterium bonnevillei]MXR19743.1 tyrosine-type recombinase/integrase [Halobacterium bonnevillei]
MSRDLESLAPDEARRLYLDARRDELTEDTLDGQDYRLRAFVAWCEEESITNLNSLSGRDLYQYRVWRREGGYSGEELENVTLRGDLATIRAFLRFCGDIDAVDTELFTQVPLPQVSHGGDVSETTLDPDRAKSILEYLSRYKYANRTHVVLLVLWNTGCRISALRALDLEDLDLDGERPNGNGPAIHFVHRPDEGTPLKNAEKSDRWNAISGYVAGVIRDYIDGPREDVTDDEGRQPLVTTREGRISRSTVRNTLYRITRPCWRGERCPHGEDPDDCVATEHGRESKCPSARSPHDVRSGRVTGYRLQKVPRVVVSDRMDVSEEILDKHYDRRSERQRAAQRREHLEGL